MRGFVKNIEELTERNEYFREVLFTAPHCQLVVMSLLPNEDIGEEVHTLDQFLRVESGEGKVFLDGESTDIKDGFAIVVPAGTKHNLVNTSSSRPLKLYTVYAPPQHRDGTIHKNKAEALEDESDHY